MFEGDAAASAGNPIRRTIERRVRSWRVVHCAEPEVIFRQAHELGRLGPSDFTDMGSVGITISRSITVSTISGSPIPASNMPMSCSSARASWPWRKALQNARWLLGGVPREHRSDSPSAFRNLDKDARADLTHRYEELCGHYGMMATP